MGQPSSQPHRRKEGSRDDESKEGEKGEGDETMRNRHVEREEEDGKTCRIQEINAGVARVPRE